MSNCQNCSNKCFEHTSGKCVTYNGESFPDVNVIQNNNVESVIEGLAKATSDLKSFVEECSACNGASNEKIAEADFSYVSSKSVTSNYHEITVETKPSEKDISLLYSIPELPSDAQVISSDIRINGKKNGYVGEIYSSSNLNDGITLQPAPVQQYVYVGKVGGFPEPPEDPPEEPEPPEPDDPEPPEFVPELVDPPVLSINWVLDLTCSPIFEISLLLELYKPSNSQYFLYKSSNAPIALVWLVPQSEHWVFIFNDVKSLMQFSKVAILEYIFNIASCIVPVKDDVEILDIFLKDDSKFSNLVSKSLLNSSCVLGLDCV